MKEQLQMVKDFHIKCQVGVELEPKLIESETALNRYKMMQEEVEEYFEGAEKGDVPNVAK